MVRAPVTFLLLFLLVACGEAEIGGVPAHEWDPSRASAEEIRAAVTDDDPWVRRLALARLDRGRLDAGKVVPALILALDDGERANREAAARALGRHGPDAAPSVDALVRIVEEDRTSIGRTAAWALGEIGIPARTRAADLLERRGHEEALHRLRLSLPTVRHAPRQQYLEDEIIVVGVDCDSRIRVRRREMSLGELAYYLQTKADSTRRDMTWPSPSTIHVFLGLDADLPWAAARAVLSVCASPDVCIDRIQLAVRRAEDGLLGRLDSSIPLREVIHRHEGLGAAETRPRTAVIHVGGEGELRPADLGGKLETLRAAGSTVSLRFRAEGGVRVRDVILHLAEVHRLGGRPLLDEFVAPGVWDGTATLSEIVRKAKEAPATDARIRWEEEP